MTRSRSSAPSPGRRSLAERRRRERLALAVGLAVSVVVHVVVVGIVGGWLAPDRAAPAPLAPTVVVPPSGMRVVDVRPVPDAGPEAPVPTEPEERLEPAVRRAPVAAAEVVPDSTPADDLTAADRLAVRVTDPRLWEPVVLLPRDPTIDDVEARIGAAVELLSDSALAEAEAAVRARDWTVKDADGGRWGISPGKIHLGKLTLPLPLFMPVDMEAVAAEQQWYELDKQLDRARILESFEDRVKAVRERRERERAARKGDNGGG